MSTQPQPSAALCEPKGGAEPSSEEPLFDLIAEGLEERGYAIVPDALARPMTDSLFQDLMSTAGAEFKPAGIGRQERFQLSRSVRSDQICWLRGATPASEMFLAWAERLRQGLNRRLFLGLFDYECHYASYPKGAFYKTHYDAFKGQATRVLSTVCYLNPAWDSGDGGELVLYEAIPEEGAGLGAQTSSKRELAKVRPEYGKLVIFLSEVFPHEVLPAVRERYSIAGWFRVNTSSASLPDPPR